MNPDVMKFPLYDSLLSEEDTPTETQWKTICSTINTMNAEHASLIYALILHHYLSSGYDLNTCRGRPYGCRLIGATKGLAFTIDHLPDTLQKIIYRYVKCTIS